MLHWKNVKKFFLVSGIGLIMFSDKSFAQPAFGIGGFGFLYSFVDTVAVNQTTSYYVYVKNTGNQPFTGQINVHTAIDTGTGFFQISQDTLWLNNILPGDTFPKSFNETYNVPPYRMGGNIVVIWPSQSGYQTTDSSLHTPVFITPANGVIAISDDRNLIVFPNPTAHEVFIKGSGRGIIAEKIIVYDARGRAIKIVEKTNSVSLVDLSGGTYLMEVEFADKSRRSFRIVKQ